MSAMRLRSRQVSLADGLQALAGQDGGGGEAGHGDAGARGIGHVDGIDETRERRHLGQQIVGGGAQRAALLRPLAQSAHSSVFAGMCS